MKPYLRARRLQCVEQKVRQRITDSRDTLAGKVRVAPDVTTQTDSMLACLRLEQINNGTHEFFSSKRLISWTLSSRKAQKLSDTLAQAISFADDETQSRA